MKYSINDTTLTAIGNAIREKTGATDTYKPTEMATAIQSITGGGGVEIEPIVLTGDIGSQLASGYFIDVVLEKFPGKVSTTAVTNASNLGKGNKTTKKIPFSINFTNTTNTDSMESLFNGMSALEEVPEIVLEDNGGSRTKITPYVIRSMFYGCEQLRSIPEDFGADWDWKNYEGGSNAANYMFYECRSLRSIPQTLLTYPFHTTASGSNAAPYVYAFQNCYNLDEIRNLGVSPASLTTNRFSSTFAACYNLAHFTFETNADGTPKTATWKSQTIDLSGNLGNVYQYATMSYINNIRGADKEVTDLFSYEELKDDPDWWTKSAAFSRYNHDSAVETINSLPDCSATGTNTIKFKGTNGSGYGKAISDLTAEEKAVATAKGWTVTIV